jgi:hypothetical protein
VGGGGVYEAATLHLVLDSVYWLSLPPTVSNYICVCQSVVMQVAMNVVPILETIFLEFMFYTKNHITVELEYNIIKETEYFVSL